MCSDCEGDGIPMASSQMYGCNFISNWSKLGRTRGKVLPQLIAKMVWKLISITGEGGGGGGVRESGLGYNPDRIDFLELSCNTFHIEFIPSFIPERTLDPE